MQTKKYIYIIVAVLAVTFTGCDEPERPTLRGKNIYNYYSEFCNNVWNEFNRALRLTEYLTLETENEKQLWLTLYYPDCTVWQTAGKDTLCLIHKSLYSGTVLQFYAIGNGVSLNASDADADWKFYLPISYENYGFTNRDNMQVLHVTHQAATPYVWNLSLAGQSVSDFGTIEASFRIESAEAMTEMLDCQISGNGIILGSCSDAEDAVLRFRITDPMIYKTRNAPAQYYHATEYQAGTIELTAMGTTNGGIDSTAVLAKWKFGNLSITYAGITESY